MNRSAPCQQPTRMADACLIALRLAGWLTISTACVAGLWALFFAVLGSFSFSGFVFHLENFAGRYVAADETRTAHLRHMFWLGNAVLFGIVGLLRHRALIRAVRLSKENGHGQ